MASPAREKQISVPNTQPPKAASQPKVEQQKQQQPVSKSNLTQQELNDRKYRTQLYQKFQVASQKYKISAQENGIKNKVQPLVQTRVETVEPSPPDFSELTHMLSKKSTKTGSILQRYFILDDDNLQQFHSVKEKTTKNITSLKLATATYTSRVKAGKSQQKRSESKSPTRSNGGEKDKWYEKDIDHKVCIELFRGKQNKLVQVYSNDICQLKALLARVKVVGGNGDLRKTYKHLITQLSMIWRIVSFQKMTKLMLAVHKKRQGRMIRFQILGQNLRDVAEREWQQNRATLLQLKSLVSSIKVEADPRILKSTFKSGKHLQHPSRPVRTAHVIQRAIEHLTYVCRTRQLSRNLQVQQELKKLSLKQEEGYLICEASITKDNKKVNLGKEKARIYLDDWLSIEDLSNEKEVQSYRFQPNDVAYICTDLDLNSKPTTQKEYNIQVFGPVLEAPNFVARETPELMYLAPLSQQVSSFYRLNVDTISLPLQFCLNYNKACTIQYRLTLLAPVKGGRNFDIYSNPVRLELSDDELRKKKVKNENISVGGFEPIDFNRMLNNPNEQFKLSVVYTHQRKAVPSILTDLIICSDQMAFQPTQHFQALQYYQIPMLKQVTLQSKKHSKGGAAINFTITQQDTTQDHCFESFKKGKRLLIGRYCLLPIDVIHRGSHSQQKVKCRIVSVSDTICTLYNIEENRMIEKPVKIEYLTLIENYGVSVYNKLPQELQKLEHEWSLNLKVKDSSLINMIQTSIQKAQVTQSKKVYNLSKLKQSVEGQLVVSIIEARGLKRSPAIKNIAQTIANDDFSDNMSIFCKIVQAGKEPLKTSIITQTKSPNDFDNRYPDTNRLLEHAPFYNSLNPLGSIIEVGSFCLDPRISVPITISLHALVKQREFLLGEVKQTSNELFQLDLKKFEPIQVLKDKTIERNLLLTHNKQMAGSITVQLRFRLSPKILSALNQFKSICLPSPASQLHFESILKMNLCDKYNFSVPLGQYYPSRSVKACKIVKDRLPLALRTKSQADNLNLLLPGESRFAHSSELEMNKLNQSLVKFLKLGMFMSRDEALDLHMSKKQQKRPESQAFAVNHHMLWNAQHDINLNDLQRQMGEELWQQFWEQLPPQTMHQIGKDDGSNLESTNLKKTIEGIVKRKDPPILPKTQLFNQGVHSLLESQIWQAKERGSLDYQRFVQLYELVQNFGFQSSQRFKLWRDIMKTELLEMYELSNFDKNYGFIPTKTVWQHLLEITQTKDCLSFQQVDQDIESFTFLPGYLQNLTPHQQNHQQLIDKMHLSQILKTLMLWTRHQQHNSEAVQFCYSPSLIHFIHRILATTATVNAAEECFWIMASIIRLYPRTFTLSQSILTADPKSTMRYEFVCFKALVERNLPQVYQQLKKIGLPLEMLVYKPIMSLYAEFFCTDVCLQLWDMMIMGFAQYEMDQRKQGLWYILAPAYMVLKATSDQLIQAQTSQELISAFEQGKTRWFNADKFAQEITIVIKELFHENVVSKPRLIGVLDYFFGEKLEIQNMAAYEMEDLRYKYQKKTSEVFQIVQEENKAIMKYAESVFRNKDLSKIKNVEVNFINTVSQQQISTKASVGNLKLQTIHLYVESLTRLPPNQSQSFFVAVETGCFSSQEFKVDQSQCSPKMIQGNQPIEFYASFNYTAPNNMIRIRLMAQNGEQISEALTPIQDLEIGKFVRYRAFLNNALVQRNEEGYNYQFGQINQIYFLQPQNLSLPQSHSQSLQELFVRKTPDIIDLYNEHLIKDQMTTDFYQIVKKDLSQLTKILNQNVKGENTMRTSEQQALQIINDTYNYIDFEDENESREDEIQLINSLTSSVQLKEFEDVHNMMSGRSQSVASTLHQKFQRTISKSSQENRFFHNSDKVLPDRKFSLRSVIVCLVLLSKTTTRDKLKTLFNMFLASDLYLPGNLRIQQVQMMVQTVFERSLFFMPQIEIQNMVETIYSKHENMVKAAYWTLMSVDQHQRIIYESQQWQNSVCNFTPDDRGLLHSLNNRLPDVSEYNIDVTNSLRESFADYFQIFGSKLVDFSNQNSPFRTLSALLNQEQANLLQDLQNQARKELSTIVLYLNIAGESFKFYLKYLKGKLVYAGSTNTETFEKQNVEPFDFKSFMVKETNRLDLTPIGQAVSKQKFFKFVDQMPMFSQLIRAQTLFSDRKSDLVPSKQVRVTVYFFVEQIQFIFYFGVQTQKNQTDDKYYYNLAPCLESDTLAELRIRLEKVLSKNQDLVDNFRQCQWFNLVQQRIWERTSDFTRLGSFNQNSLVFKLKKSHQINDAKLKFDCHSLYRHADQSYQWRPCRIVFRERKVYANSQKQNTNVQSQKFGTVVNEVIQANPAQVRKDDPSPVRDEAVVRFGNALVTKMNIGGDQGEKFQFDQLQYTYIVEFEHLSELGDKFWCRRKYSEILFSKERTRYQTPEFYTSNSLYIMQLYQKLEK